jgi:hypothetical protein
MGIQIEFNPDLALRDNSHVAQGRRPEECLPEKIEVGKTYSFLKQGQRNYWLLGELPLLETKGNQQLSLPLASIIIERVEHVLIDGVPWTRGEYRVIEIIKRGDIRFNGFAKIL